LTDWRTAAVDGRMRATLGLLEKLTLAPGEVAAEDLVELRAAGLSDRAILDAAYVCMGFNIITRIANALGFKVPPDEVFSRASRYLTFFGYNVLSGFWARGIYQQLVALLLVNKSAAGGGGAFDPYEKKLTLLRHSVLSEPGTLDPAVRWAICDGLELPEPLGAYVRKVVEHAHTVGDEDIAELHCAGYTDDQIFEATVSAALGAGLFRLRRILVALRPAS
jgi:alkylhydroperoxidase family enzyme